MISRENVILFTPMLHEVATGEPAKEIYIAYKTGKSPTTGTWRTTFRRCNRESGGFVLLLKDEPLLVLRQWK
jgi:hypothetical protein